MATATIARPKTPAKPKTAVARIARRDDSDLKLESNRRMSWIDEGGIDLRAARAEAARKAGKPKKARKARPKARVKPRPASRPKARSKGKRAKTAKIKKSGRKRLA